MDVGVKCFSFTDACAVPVTEMSTNKTQPPTNTQPSDGATTSQPSDGATTSQPSDGATTSQPSDGATTSQPSDGATTSQPSDGATTSQPSDGAITECSISQRTVMSTSETLGALIGLLAAALVAVVTGWIMSCVYFQRKINK